MRRAFLFLACSLVLAGQSSAAPAFRPDVAAAVPAVATAASASFQRCMRKRYGPHYFRGVKRAHRYFMAQACGG